MRFSSSPPQINQPTNRQIWKWPIILIAILLIITVGIVYWLQLQVKNTGFTSNRSEKQVIIGDDALKIPKNYLRFASQRRARTLKQADLMMLWPHGEGYSDALIDEFKHSKNLIFITLTKREQKLDMSARYAPIYTNLLDGSQADGSAGLVMRGFKKGVGYDDEVLATFIQDQNTWVARCYQAQKDKTQSTCLRDVFVGSKLSVLYRFNAENLKNWRGIEKLVLTKVQSMLTR